MHWWVLAKRKTGKRFLLGPFPTDVAANEEAIKHGDAKVYPLDTIDDARAARLIKFQLSKVNADSLEEKLGHKV